MSTLHRHIFTILLAGFFLLSAGMIRTAEGQQVNFGMHAGEGLTLTPQIPDKLHFGDMFSNEGTVQIDLNDNEAVPIEIEGVAYLDVTVTLEPPAGGKLVLEGNTEYVGDANRSMPVNIRMAYYNKGQENISEADAKTQAVEVVGNSITFQIRRRPGGPPGPPPTPPHSGYTPPTAKAYLYIYGELDVGDVHAGPYSGLINVHVEYSTYQEN